MNPDRWMRVKDVFHAALERPPEARSTFVAEACDGDAEIRVEIDRLLVAHAEAGSFIEDAPVHQHSMMTGRSIGRYAIGRLIGVGGMGEVYAARDTELGREVALKIGSDRDVEAQARLRREAQHASQLNHPHICTIHEVGVSEGQAYIVMEYVEGERLTDVIPRDGLDIEHLVRYGIQIADGLAHAHRHGVSHRDLKTENVVITPDGRAKILDFGLARRLSDHEVKALSESHASIPGDNLIVGTLSTLAPEVLRGERADARSDIWALGVLLYEMAAGHRPFSGATGFELSGAILHEDPAPLSSEVPGALQTIVRRCLAKDPGERYQQVVDVEEDLESVQGRKSSFSWRAAAAIIAIVGVALTLAFVWKSLRPVNAPVAVGPSGRPAIAVMRFENVGGAQSEDVRWLSEGVPSMLLTGLAETRGLDIVSARQLLDTLKQTGGTSLAALDRTQAADIARRAGAGAVVVGSIFRSANEIRIDAQVEDLSSGRVLAANSVRGTDIFALIDQLTAQIRDGMGIPRAANIRSVAEVATSSLEAYRFYSDGMEAFSNTRWLDAEKLFKEAIALDPSFAEVYVRLASVSVATGRQAARREYLRRAAEYAHRLSERQRLLLTVLLALDRGDSAEAARAIDDVVAKFPDLVEVYLTANELYQPIIGLLPDVGKRQAIAKRGATAVPSSTSTRNVYGYALLDAGRYADALAEFEAYARLAPREPNPYDSLGEAYLRMGAPEKAIEHYARALAIDPGFSRNGKAWSLAIVGRLDEAIAEEASIPELSAVILSRAGKYREAQHKIDMGAKTADDNGNAANAGGLRLLSAVFAIERQDHARALQEVRAAEKIFETLPERIKRVYRVAANLVAGLAELRAGRMSQALSRLESQKKIYDATVEAERWWYRALEGEIALTRGDIEQAATAFSHGEPSIRLFILDSVVASVLLNDQPSRDGLARVAKARGDVIGAIGVYRGLLVYGPDDKWEAPFEPLYVIEIARLLEKVGQKEAALTEYERFLALWKNADDDLPELAEARRAILRLRTVS